MIATGSSDNLTVSIVGSYLIWFKAAGHSQQNESLCWSEGEDWKNGAAILRLIRQPSHLRVFKGTWTLHCRSKELTSTSRTRHKETSVSSSKSSFQSSLESGAQEGRGILLMINHDPTISWFKKKKKTVQKADKIMKKNSNFRMRIYLGCWQKARKY